MLFLLLIQILLPKVPPVQSDDIRIVIASSFDEPAIRYFGLKDDLITDVEAERFGLLPESECVERIGLFSGRDPTHCYLREPTPVQLYPAYDWTEVRSVYRIRNVKMLSKRATPVTLRRRILENASDNIMNLTLLGTKLEVYDTITHRVVEPCGIRGSLTVLYDGDRSYNHTWGIEEQTKYVRRFEATVSMEVEIPPRSKMESTFQVSEQIAEYEITYENFLVGQVIGDYNPKYNDHHFHAYSIGMLLPNHALSYRERLGIESHLGDVTTDSTIVPLESNAEN